MWSVAIVDRSGAVVEVLSSGDRELRGAVAFAAGYGATDRGAVVVVPSAAVEMFEQEKAECERLPTEELSEAVEAAGCWDVFMRDAGGETQLNSTEYDSEQVVAALDSIAGESINCAEVRIVRTCRRVLMFQH